MKTKYTLTDTFNKRVISSHWSALAAVRARRAHVRAVRRASGSDSYLWYSITRNDGQECADEICAAMETMANR